MAKFSCVVSAVADLGSETSQYISKLKAENHRSKCLTHTRNRGSPKEATESKKLAPKSVSCGTGSQTSPMWREKRGTVNRDGHWAVRTRRAAGWTVHLAAGNTLSECHLSLRHPIAAWM